ncbi:hypothetical protein L873DRAFT_1280230 [Choiromyces venosus 120613-1]|uniref:4Fe-4S ferredoxin-type domain-containing protein n=1 Tax=Choiromyces venosus 120613-1 TaxID=1336337 RepID=A0A3N4K2C0_9PEZI|nr:hypothetical protein L873DRAFT_1280230 [Choiromyces venosus 120613-1]
MIRVTMFLLFVHIIGRDDGEMEVINMYSQCCGICKTDCYCIPEDPEALAETWVACNSRLFYKRHDITSRGSYPEQNNQLKCCLA